MAAKRGKAAAASWPPLVTTRCTSASSSPASSTCLNEDGHSASTLTLADMAGMWLTRRAEGDACGSKAGWVEAAAAGGGGSCSPENSALSGAPHAK